MPDATAGAVPAAVMADAWRGADVRGGFSSQAFAWGVGQPEPTAVRILAPEDVDTDRWDEPSVGWGLVLLDDDRVSAADRAAGKDAPEPLQALVAARGPAPVLRYRHDHPLGSTHLFRYYAGHEEPEAIPIGGSPRGVAPGALPRYLMLWGDPGQLPWRLQYQLNLDPRLVVGRLPLVGDGLANYVRAALAGWPDAADAGRAVVWATDHAPDDITRLMRLAVADEVGRAYADDDDVEVHRLSGPEATVDALHRNCAEHRPGVVVTTSHGYTGPMGRPDPDRLGLLVDQEHELLYPAALLAHWEPAGAIWYAHACSGAGADEQSSFAGVFEPGSALATMISEVAGLGSRVSPFPVAMLGAPSPLRAFIGHVEPTFDWTLRHATSRHALTADVVEGLYRHLLLGRPVAEAMHNHHLTAGQYAGSLDDVRAAVLEGRAEPDEALFTRMAYLDRRSLVVLGDPAAALPSLAHTGAGNRVGTPAGLPSGR